MENTEKSYFENAVMKMGTEVNDAIDELDHYMSPGSDAMPLGVLIWFLMLPKLKKRLGDELFYIDLNALNDSKENAIALFEEFEEKLAHEKPPMSFDDIIQRLKAAD